MRWCCVSLGFLLAMLELSGCSSGVSVVRDYEGELPSVAGGVGTDPVLTVTGDVVPDQVVVEVLEEGDGAKVTLADVITVDYAGYLWSDGTKFEDTFTTGAQSVYLADQIEGWKYGLEGVSVGSRVLLTVPAKYGYSSDDTDSVAADSDLVFVIDILAANTVDSSSLKQAEQVTETLVEGVRVTGTLGSEPKVSFGSDTAVPEEESIVLLAKGQGQEISTSDQVVYHYTTYEWGETEATYSDWDSSPLISEAYNTVFIGETVGSRIGYVAIRGDKTLVMIYDIIAAYEGQG